jgi:hypothetical protein
MLIGELLGCSEVAQTASKEAQQGAGMPGQVRFRICWDGLAVRLRRSQTSHAVPSSAARWSMAIPAHAVMCSLSEGALTQAAANASAFEGLCWWC